MQNLNGDTERMLVKKLLLLTFVTVSKTTGSLRCGKGPPELPDAVRTSESQADDAISYVDEELAEVSYVQQFSDGKEDRSRSDQELSKDD